jgi:hypothetical protein
MGEHKVILQCDVCGSDYQFGPHRYDGHKCRGYEIFVCHPCNSSNWDGWGPMLEPKILKILEQKEIPVPKRNADGWLPREF